MNQDVFAMAGAMKRAMNDEGFEADDQMAMLTMVVAMTAAEMCGPDMDCIRHNLAAFSGDLARVTFAGPDEQGMFTLQFHPASAVQ